VGKSHLVKLWSTSVATDLTGNCSCPLLSTQPVSPPKGMAFPASGSQHINDTYGEGISKCGLAVKGHEFHSCLYYRFALWPWESHFIKVTG
jgi:hypothetical protein